MQSFEKCRNCGAPLEAAADGRSVQCGYCGAGEARAIDPSRLATALRAETGSIGQLFDSLAERLGKDLPDLTTVVRRGGLFSSRKIEGLEVLFEDRVFRLKREGARVVAQRGEVVRGIVLKTEDVPMDAWIQALSEALSTHAGTNSRTLEALRRIGG